VVFAASFAAFVVALALASMVAFASLNGIIVWN